MSHFLSYSQCGQDRFVNAVLGGKRNGIFADVGMSDPIEINNTYAFERMGWTGFMVDNDPGCVEKMAKTDRRMPLIMADSTKLIWDPMAARFGKEFDYLSLDVDSATLATLKLIPFHHISFKVLTVEHDFYRFGPDPRREMRAILNAADYFLVCADVISDGLEFEDWWVHRSIQAHAESRFRCDSTPWQEIMKKI